MCIIFLERARNRGLGPASMILIALRYIAVVTRYRGLGPASMILIALRYIAVVTRYKVIVCYTVYRRILLMADYIRSY